MRLQLLEKIFHVLPKVYGNCFVLLDFQSNTATQDKSFMRNKISQIFSLSCVADYPRRWPGFFTDLLQTLPPDPQAADLYLRILLAVDMEVVDREIVHSQQARII